MKKYIFLFIIITSTFLLKAQFVNIPDPNFKAFLTSTFQFDANQDGEISFAEAAAATGKMSCSGLSISDLTGIEAFTGIYWLECSNNNLTTLDVSNNSSLTILDAFLNQLSSVILNNNSLDNVQLSNNNLTTLDVSTSVNITALSLTDNPISAIDVSNNLSLDLLGISNTNIVQLDLSNNSVFQRLFASNTLIDSLNVVGNQNLINLLVSNNQNLTYLNVKNSNNTAIFFFDATNNPNLACIEVDNVAWSNSNWISKDPTAIYSLDCSTVGFSENRQQEIEIVVYPNPTNGYVTIQLDEIPKNVVINIKDVLGKTLLEQKLNSTNTIINVSSLPKGIYYVELINGSYKYTKKLVVQ